jgi:uncharacterized protein (TIGR00730 family)
MRAVDESPVVPRRICVFCGSSPGVNPAYAEAARHLGRTLAGRGIGLVYGGGSVGLMGVMADAALAAGGQVIGVIPRALQLRELGHAGLSELHVVGSMHERKAKMAELADAFVAMPGGMGTLEEFAEILTWAQLGLHAKPIGVLNVAGYFDGLRALVEQGIAERFIHPGYRVLLTYAADVDDLLEALARWQPPAGFRKWLTLEES